MIHGSIIFLSYCFNINSVLHLVVLVVFSKCLKYQVETSLVGGLHEYFTKLWVWIRTVWKISSYLDLHWMCCSGFPVWLRDIPGIEFRTDNAPFKVQPPKKMLLYFNICIFLVLLQYLVLFLVELYSMSCVSSINHITVWAISRFLFSPFNNHLFFPFPCLFFVLFCIGGYIGSQIFPSMYMC